MDTPVNVGLAAAVFPAVTLEGWLRPPTRGVPDGSDDDSDRHEEFEELFGDEPWDVVGEGNWLAVLMGATAMVSVVWLVQSRSGRL